ncbi:hypothetical protein DH2020_001103 [Rehmannia glutinosa]|uniref:Xaa-Pro dipeptidyl-peptidase-like domain-containing protein n=1 Tax=Rehmannia glutinosa TaxID=99300 RepID=A0ABR0XYG1_REHGL
MGVASGLANRGYKSVTFDMRGVGSSTGKASLTGFNEIEDVIAVCKWASLNLSAHRILLVGSSAVFGEQIQSRKLLISVNSLSVNKGLLSGAMVEPEKAVENGLRKRPPTSSNPTQNK